MENPVYHNLILFLDFEQHSELPYAKPLFRCEVGQPLNISA